LTPVAIAPNEELSFDFKTTHQEVIIMVNTA